jgi:RNA polymerase primary sigma factor
MRQKSHTGIASLPIISLHKRCSYQFGEYKGGNMVAVLEKFKDREQVSSGDELSYVGDEDVDQEEQLSTSDAGSQDPKLELGDDLLDLYFSEVGRTSLLNDEETRMLASQIEDGEHLARVEKEWIAGHGVKPSAIELLLAVAERLTGVWAIFETIYHYLKLPAHGSIAKKVLHPDLRSAIDSKIDQGLCDAIAEIIGASPTTIEKSTIELSLDSRLMPWDIMEEAGLRISLAQLSDLLQSPEFRDKLEVHRSEIAKHFERIREKARQASGRMIQANLRLVVSVAKGHMSWGVPLSDLIQEGNIGLMQAVRKFDHRRGTKFSTYATPWIWQAVNRAVNDKSRIVRLPGHVVEQLTKLGKARNNLAQKLGRQPTEKELISETRLPPKKIKVLLELISGGTVSLDTPVGEDGCQLGDFIADQTILQPEEQATTSLLSEELNRTLESLTPRERRVIELRYGLGNERSRTLCEVGTELSLTKERIRQIEKEALTKLRHPSQSRKLIGYLG